MSRFLSLCFVGLFLFSCENDHKQLCECIEIGDQVNQLSESFFNRTYSEAGKDSLDALIKERDVLCKPYLEMGALELQEAKGNCDQLDVERNR